MKKISSLILLLLFSFSLSAQTEISSFSSTGAGYTTATINDYQCLGINPANLGWSKNDFSMNLGLSEFAGSIYSEPLTKKQIQHDLLYNPITLDLQGKKDAAKAFTNTTLFASGSIMWVGFSYQNEKIGGFAFSIRDRFVWHTILNESAANFLFLGYNDPYFDSTAFENGDQVGYSTNPQNASVVYRGSDQHMLMYREFNLGYGRKVVKNDNFALYLGVNFKYLMGLAMTRYYQGDDGKLIANSSLSPGFNVEFTGDGVYDEEVDKLTGNGLKTVGSGFGFDVGLTIEVIKKLKIGLAVNDIGSITWKKNLYEGVDGNVWRIDTPGINNYNIFSEGQLINTDNGPPPDDTTFVGIKEKKINLPMNFRGGVSYRFNDIIEAGFDVYLPLGDKVPGNIEAPVFGIGTKVNPAKWVQLSVSVVNGGKFGTNVPLGISFFPINNDNTIWEVGLASRDMLSFFKQVNPTVSYAFGFLRFTFGAKEKSARYLEE